MVFFLKIFFGQVPVGFTFVEILSPVKDSY